MMLTVTPFEPEHLELMTLQPHQESSRHLVQGGYGTHLKAAGPALTTWSHGEPVACFGTWVKWPGTAEVWAFLSANIGGYGLLASMRVAQRMFDSAEHDRLQAFVEASFAPGVRLMLDLGFTVEGKMAKYFPNGADAFLFARVRGAVSPSPIARIQTERPAPGLREILELEAQLKRLEPKEGRLEHHFARGIYARVLHIDRGDCAVGKMHRFDHFCIVLKGDVDLLTDAGVRRVRGGTMLPSRAGIKRVVYAHEDTTFVTFHGTGTTDLDELERELIVPSCEVIA